MQLRTLGQLLAQPRVARAWHSSQVVNRRVPAEVDAVCNGPLGHDYLECAAARSGRHRAA